MWLINWNLHFLQWNTCSFILKSGPPNAENHILGLEISQFSEAQRPPKASLLPLKRGLTVSGWHSRLIYSNLAATSIFIETPGTLFLKQCLWCCKYKKPIHKELTMYAVDYWAYSNYYLFIILEVNPCFSFHKCSRYLHDNGFYCIGTAPPLHGES